MDLAGIYKGLQNEAHIIVIWTSLGSAIFESEEAPTPESAFAKHMLSLECMQRLLGGYVERVPDGYHLLRDYDVWCNEDGIRLELERNIAAELVISAAGPLYGNIILSRKGMVD